MSLLPQIHFDASDPALVIALALALGMIGQTLARHLRVPGIVVLLALGVLTGPDLLDLVRPASLGEAMQLLVGFAVAIILFEGGLSLDLRRLRRQALAIRGLVTIGALVTTVGGAIAAHLLLGWPWLQSLLFGTLVIVTGPTVINPLLRRIRVDRKVAVILEAEGIFGDAIGALVALVALEFALQPSGASLAAGLADFVARLAIGGAMGIVAGLVIERALSIEGLMPDGLGNVFALTVVLLVFQLSNSLLHESGIAAVIIAGTVVGNRGTHAAEELEELKEFKEQLVVMFIGMLFVLLAADIRIDTVAALGTPGLWTVAVLMLLVRPLNVWLSTIGTDLDWREKLFLSWLAPRGIVAAAVASLFAITLENNGIAGGKDLRALVFLVIAVTVLVQGLTGGVVARLLGLKPPPPTGVVILGAQALGLALAEGLRSVGRDVVLVDSNPENCHRAEERGFRVLYGSGLDENVLARAHVEDRQIAIGATANEDVNFAFARRVRREAGIPIVQVGLRRGHRSVTAEMVSRMGGKVLFGGPRNLNFWTLQLERGRAAVEHWEYDPERGDGGAPLPEAADSQPTVLPLAGRREGKLLLPDADLSLRAGDRFFFAVLSSGHDSAVGDLERRGWRRVLEEAPAAVASQAADGDSSRNV